MFIHLYNLGIKKNCKQEGNKFLRVPLKNKEIFLQNKCQKLNLKFHISYLSKK